MIKRIAFIHIAYPCGGSEKVTSYVASQLLKEGYQCYIYCQEIIEEKLTNLDKEISLRVFPKGSLYTPQGFEYLKQQIKTNGIDLIICPGVAVPYLDRLRKETNAKVLFALHSMPFWEEKAIAANAQLRSKESAWKWFEWHFLRKWKYRQPNYLEKKVLRNYKALYSQVDLLTVLCDSYKNELEKKLAIDPTTSKVMVMVNPITMQDAPIIYSKQKKVVYVGRLSYADKRIDRLLRIWQQVQKNSDWQLEIYGGGEEKENLIALAKELDLKRVSFKGFTTDTQKIYDEASIICLTSSYEGWPLVLVEAQKNGVIPVAMNCCSGIETIIDSEKKGAGFLIPSGDEQSFATTLNRIMIDENERKEVQKICIEQAKKYSLERIIEDWKKMISSFE